MRYSKLLGKTLREAPSGAETISHKLLVRAGFIDQLMAGVFTFLPLGLRVHRKIEDIIREEINAIGGQEVFLPTLQKKEQWLETGRWETIDPPLFKFQDRHGKELALGSTHEEIITDLARRFIQSYRDLPVAVYQIQNKFRNELRSSGGLLRVKEFIMKDLYSFDESEAGVADYFEKVKGAYQKIFRRLGVPAIASKASGGTIGGTTTYEFQVPSKAGEDKIILCRKCNFAVNKEIEAETVRCSNCGSKDLEEMATIEVGHIFNLGIDYSEKMAANFVDRDGKQKPLQMGCYGIGVGRLMATIIEVHHDEKGMIWPESAAPYQVHLIALEGNNAKVKAAAEKAYQELLAAGVEVLYDDRDESAGVKFIDADLIGIPWRIVISPESLRRGGVEMKKRNEQKTKVVSLNKLLYILRNAVNLPDLTGCQEQVK